MAQCYLCGESVETPCLSWILEQEQGDFLPSDAIKECPNFQKVAEGPRGPNGGLLRVTSEVDMSTDLIMQSVTRELPLAFVRGFVPDFV